jgi:WD40 repeat protein
LSGLAVSKDAKKLAAVTDEQTIKVFDLVTGKETREIGQKSPTSRFVSEQVQNANPLAWSPCSCWIAQANRNGYVRIWTVETGKGNALGPGHLGMISGLVITPGGKSALTLGIDMTVRSWDLEKAIERDVSSLPLATSYAALLGQREGVLIQRTDGSVAVWDSGARKSMSELRCKLGLNSLIDTSQDGRSLHMIEQLGRWSASYRLLKVYDIETGEERRDFATQWIGEDASDRKAFLVSVISSSRRHRVAATVGEFVPGAGIGLGGAYRYQIRCKKSEKDMPLWETKPTIWENDEFCKAIAFSPDDRSVLVFNAGIRERKVHSYLSLLEVHTGSVRCVIPINDESIPVHAFSLDGDFLAFGALSTTIVFDVRLGREICRLSGEQGPIQCLAFGPQSSTLYTAGTDGTVLVWDVGPSLKKARMNVDLAPKELAGGWTELADRDTVRAYRAVSKLVSSPSQSVRYLSEKISLRKIVPVDQIDKLVMELQSKKYDTREKSSHALREAGLQAVPALKRNLDRPASPEGRRRIEMLLVDIEHRESYIGTEVLREIRAIEALEAMRTPESRLILESLAKGAPCTITEEAVRAVERLRRESR